MTTLRALRYGVAAMIAGLLTTAAMPVPIGWKNAAPQGVLTRNELAIRVDAYMRAAVANHQFTGAVLIARDGKPLIDAAYGMANYELGVPNTPQTVFHIASLTKQFTAMAIMQLRDSGKLDVNASICAYIADCPPAWNPVTIRHLLTHTSGIRNVSSLPEWDDDLSLKRYRRSEFVDLFRYLPLRFVPGERYEYSNSGYFLLGLIVERASGMGFGDYLKANVFTPLGMSRSGYDDNRAVVPGAASGYYSRGTAFITATYVDPSTRLGDTGVVSTTGDMLRWDQALYTDKLVRQRTLDEIFTPYRNGYGYGWEIGTRFGRKTIAHSGSDGGFSSYILRFPDDRMTVVILGNGDRMSAARAAIDLSAIIFRAPYKMPAPQLRDELWDALARGGVAGATGMFDLVRKATPPRSDATGETLIELGYDLIDARKLIEADAVFRLALQRFPDLAYAWDGLADSAAARDDRSAAIGYFERSLKLDPSNEYAVRGLARLRRVPQFAN